MARRRGPSGEVRTALYEPEVYDIDVAALLQGCLRQGKALGVQLYVGPRCGVPERRGASPDDLTVALGIERIEGALDFEARADTAYRALRRARRSLQRSRGASRCQQPSRPRG